MIVSKTADIHFRTKEGIKQQIELAASLSGKTVSEYCEQVLSSASGYVRPLLQDSGANEKRERTRRKNETMNIRVSEEDKKAIEKMADMAELSPGEYMIRAALADKTVVVIDGKKLLHQVSKIGTNLNQLTILAHQGKITCPDLTEVNRTLNKVLKQLVRVVKDR